MIFNQFRIIYVPISCLAIAAVLGGAWLSGCASTSTPKEPNRNDPQKSGAHSQREKPRAGSIEFVLQQTKRPGFETVKTIGIGKSSYQLLVHSPELLPLIKDSYSTEDVAKLNSFLVQTLTIPLDSRALAKAADRVQEGEVDPTNYDAIWVRDSLWVYLGLKANPAEVAQAKRLLLTLTDYFASEDQLQRFRSVIQNPKVIDGPEGPMNVVHIRFDGRSPSFQDVQVDGKAQKWNHKQNDALGLYLDLVSRAIMAGELTPEDLTPQRVEVLTLFPRYFAAIRFHQMPDAGSWEEIERTNTSSIALVTSGLERYSEMVAKPSGPSAAAIAQLAAKTNRAQLAKLLDQGYTVVRKQLARGGESPTYTKNDPRYRTSDAALLNLIYPARLTRLQKSDYERVIKAVQPLIGKVGIKRYLKDSYQSGNFWFTEALAAQAPVSAQNQSPNQGQAAKTDDTSSAQDFLARGKQFIDDSEAQWFFDSWYSLAIGIMHERFGQKEHKDEQIKFLNRALAQVTGGAPGAEVLGADGNPVVSRALPESYNTVVDPKSRERVFAPSPITPLNWAKASLRLALAQAATSR